MKKKELSQLRTKSIDELAKTAAQLNEEIAQLSLEVKVGKHKNVRTIKNKRRELAQVLTVLREKELLSETEMEEAEK